MRLKAYLASWRPAMRAGNDAAVSDKRLHPTRTDLVVRTTPKWLLLAVGVGAIVPLALIVLFRVHAGIGVADMTRDPSSIAHIHPLLGALSSLGVLLWSGCAAIWLFCAGVLRSLRESDAARFSLVSGILSAYFALDDLFQVHEFLAPTYLGLPERAVYGLLAVATVWYLWAFRRQLVGDDVVLLLVSYCLLAMSVSIDAVFEKWLWRLEEWTYLLEDGFKWTGIIFWLAFGDVPGRGVRVTG